MMSEEKRGHLQGPSFVLKLCLSVNYTQKLDTHIIRYGKSYIMTFFLRNPTVLFPVSYTNVHLCRRVVLLLTNPI